MLSRLKPALLLIWFAWAGLVWLSSGELSRASDVWRLVPLVFLPPWPHLMEAINRAFNAVAGALLVLASALAVGRMAVRFLGKSRRSPYGRLVTTAAGMPLLALLVQGLGLAGILDRRLLGLLLVALPLLLLRGWKRKAKKKPARQEKRDSLATLLYVISGLAAVAVAVGTLAPATAWDELVYHLRAPELYLLAHKVYPIPEIFPAYFPFNGEMLFLLASVAGGDAAAKLIHVACWLGCALAVYRLARAMWGGSAGSIGMALLISIPLGMNIATRAYTDFIALLPFLCGLLVLRGGVKPATSRRAMALAGLLAGAACGTRYLGGILAVALLVTVLSGMRRGRINAAVIFLVTALVGGGAWYLRNLLWTGNPVYPLIFGGPRWTPLDMAGWNGDADVRSFTLAGIFGAPTRLLGVFNLDGGISPLLIGAVAVPFLWFRWVRGWPWIMALALGLVWLLTPMTRYLLPTLAVLCVAVAGIGSRIPIKGIKGERLFRYLVVASSILLVPCGIKAIAANSDSYGVAVGKVAEQEYRLAHFSPPGYMETLDILGRAVPEHSRVYLLGHIFASGLPKSAWFDYLYVRPPLYWWVTGAGSAERIAVRARQANLTHIAYNPRGGRGILGDRPELMEWDPKDLRAWMGFWESRVERVGKVGAMEIFRINRRNGNHPLPTRTMPGTENITAPIDRMLEEGKNADAEEAIRKGLEKYPGFTNLNERMDRMKGSEAGIL